MGSLTSYIGFLSDVELTTSRVAARRHPNWATGAWTKHRSTDKSPIPGQLLAQYWSPADPPTDPLWIDWKK